MIRAWFRFILLLAIVMALVNPAVSGTVPIGHHAERTALPDGTVQQILLGYPKYYGEPGNWQPTVEEFAAGVGEWACEATRGVHTIRVKRDGTIRCEHLDGAIVQRFVGLAGVKADGTTVQMTTVDLSTWVFAFKANAATWTHPQGIIVQVQYVADQARTVVTIPQTRLADVKVLAQTAMAVAVGPIWDWDESGLGPQWTCSVPDRVNTQDTIAWLRNGRVKQRLRPSIGSAGETTWPKRRVRDKAGRSLVEAVEVKALDDAKVPLVFNDTLAYQEGTAGYSGCIDCRIASAAPDSNFDGAGWPLFIGNFDVVRSFLAFDLHIGEVGYIPAGSTVTNAYYTLECSEVGGVGGCTFGFFQVWKPWVETTVTWNDWDSPNKEWATAGCNNADDAGPENAGDGVGADRAATAVITTAFPGATGTYTYGSGVAVFKNLVQAWVDSTYTHTRGIIMADTAAGPDYCKFRTSEYATTAERPILTVVYTPPGGGPALPVLLHHYRQQGTH